MAKRLAVILGHPDPDEAHLCRALANAYADGAAAAGHEVEMVDLATLDFPLLRSQNAFLHEDAPETLKPAQAAIERADHLVFVFPLWLGTMPALLKAFFEQVMRPGFAFAYQDNGIPKKLLKGRSARVIVTMGMPGFLYRFWFFEHGLRNLRRNILNFTGLSPVRETLFGMAQSSSEAKRHAWIEKARTLGARAI